MELTIEPTKGLIDAPSVVTVQGAAADSVVTLTLSTVDAAGHSWRSSGDYQVGPDGAVVLSDPDKPWWDMAFTDSAVPPVAFTAPVSCLDYAATVTANGRSAAVTVTRCWGRDVSSTDLSGPGWLLRIFRAADKSAPQRPGVVIIPGSTGLAAAAPTAALLASHGYPSGVLAYMQESGLPPNFQQIALEAINAGIGAFAGQPDVAAGKVTVLAQSVGTAVALSALTEPGAPAVRSVVLVAPTNVVWQALGGGGRPPKASSLTWDGHDLPYVPLRGDKLMGQVLKNAIQGRLTRKPHSSALTMRPAYQAGLKATAAVTAATIPVDRITAPMLVIAGTQDAMWPADSMARALIARRGNRSDDQLLILPGAGHFLRPPTTPSTVARNDALISGGTPDGIATGQRTAWDAILQHLAAG